MSNEIKILPAAWDDLRAIADYYSISFSADSALKVTNHILDVIARLGEFPESGSLTPDKWLNQRGYRMVIARRHAAIYRVIDNSVYIYHIMDMRRDYPKIFRQEIDKKN